MNTRPKAWDDLDIETQRIFEDTYGKLTPEENDMVWGDC